MKEEKLLRVKDIMDVKRATKRKPASITIKVEDEIAQAAIQKILRYFPVRFVGVFRLFEEEEEVQNA